MLYLFDENVLITASNMYYPLEAVPEFWEWIDYHAGNERIKLPVEILGRRPRGPDAASPAVHAF